ncbi:hypothetical protein AAP77_24245, partial [Salmonella enterica subsp. enterica]|nr:hypothetical protein [Salmonella enterica subsp. enterica serovar Napoli]EBV5528334.1 hypothetical protein [Salmonella enterica subsp. enterica serovar Napoli]ECF7026194.1 hypothetical protein [Salmonella enterica subsp. enterica]
YAEKAATDNARARTISLILFIRTPVKDIKDNSLIPNLLLHPSTTDNTPKTSSPIRKKQYRCLNIYLHIKIASGIWHLASGIWHLASGIWQSGFKHTGIQISYWIAQVFKTNKRH